MRSDFVDVSDIISRIASDTTELEDTTSLAVIRVPENIDFDFNAVINKFAYDKIKAENVKGHIIVRNGILSFRETGLNILGGLVSLNADYDTRDSLKPMMKADLSIQNIGVKDAFNTFNTIQKLAPAAAGVDGKMNVKLSYQSLIGSDMMPLIATITGGGKLQSSEITLLKSAAYDKMKELLKLSDKYSNTFRDLNLSFKLSNGRVYVSPFDTKVGNIKMNISGDQGLDQTMNYLIKTEFPRSELGSSINSMVNNLSALAASYGVAYKPADVMKVNVKLTGVFGKPVVIPVFGSGSSEGTAGTTKETVKQVVGNTIDEGKEKARKEAEAQGDKLIQEAETAAHKIRDEAADAAGKIRKEADAEAQKLVADAAPKVALKKLAAQKAADKLKQEADKRATQLTTEADTRATQLIEEAKVRKQELIDKI
jgi:vacuolar-type H+-ATPase subunit H